MDILVSRKISTDVCMIGEFSTDGKMWHSLELPLFFEGQQDVPDKCCIPAGVYVVKNLYSEKHQMLMPHVIVPHVDGVLDRTEIEIHAASRPIDLLGCTAIGDNLVDDTPTSVEDIVINGSQRGFSEFRVMFDNAVAAGEDVSITYSNDF